GHGADRDDSIPSSTWPPRSKSRSPERIGRRATLGLGDQLDERERRRVAGAGAGLEDPGVAASAAHELRRDVVEERGERDVVPEDAAGHALGMDELGALL